MERNWSIFHVTSRTTVPAFEIKKQNYSCPLKNDSEQLENDFLRTNQLMIHVFENLFLVLLIIIAVAIGTEITCTQIKMQIKNPASIVIAMVIQFFIKPLVAYVLMRSSTVSKENAIMILIISCCPSEVLSSAFTYFCDGDLTLSVIITTASAALAMVMMPLNLWVYGHSFETEKVIVPYDMLSLYPVYAIAFLVLGMLLKWKFPSAAHLLSMTGNYIGQVIVIVCIALQASVFRHMFFDVSVKLYGLIITFPLLSSFLGYILAYSFRQTVPAKKTIAIDSGLQNTYRVLRIVAGSFDPEVQRNIILLPWLCAFIMTTTYTAFCVAYQIRKQYLLQKNKKENGFDLTYIGQTAV